MKKWIVRIMFWAILVTGIYFGRNFLWEIVKKIIPEVSPVNASIVTFTSLSIFFLLWIGVYFLSQKEIFFAPIRTGEIMVATWQGIPREFFGKFPWGSYVDNNNPTRRIVEGYRHIDARTGIVHCGQGWRTPLEKLFGVVWIGFPPYGRIHDWKLSYLAWDKNAEGKDVLKPVKDKTVRSLHIRPTFAFEVKDAETKDKVQLTIRGKYTLCLGNASIAIFTNKNWTENIEAAIVAVIVDYLRKKTYDQFLAEQTELGVDFLPKILSVNHDDIGNSSIGRYGFLLEDLSVTSTTIGGPNQEEVTKATTAKKVAKEYAKAEKEKAKGLQATIDALGPNANQIGTIRLAEAIEKHPGSLALGGSIMSSLNI